MKKFSGRRLKAARALSGLTQEQLAEVTGIKPNTVSAYERHVQVPNANRLALISDATDTPIADFFDEVAS